MSVRADPEPDGNWRHATAEAIAPGNVVRTAAGEVLTVSRIERPFMGRDEMLAVIEDTSQRWYKRPMRCDAEVDILQT